MVRKISLGFVLVLVISAAIYFRSHHTKHPLGVAYAGDRNVILWSTSAQVREPVAAVSFGERLVVLDHFEDQVEVRTPSGVVGWTTDQELLSADLWQKAQDLAARAASLPVEARGATRVLSNLHLEPSRESQRISQLGKEVPVELFERRAVEVPVAAPSGEGAEEEEPPSQPDSARKEDWWLVRAHPPGQAPLAGWVLGRFIDLDVPPPLPDYATSAALRIVAWFVLDRVPGGAGADVGNDRPQYLVLGAHGPEGDPCDFTSIRVYTWSRKNQRYETAYVESALCGALPVTLSPPRVPGGEVTFEFEDIGNGTPEKRIYRMVQTVVRRVKE